MEAVARAGGIFLLPFFFGLSSSCRPLVAQVYTGLPVSAQRWMGAQEMPENNTRRILILLLLLCLPLPGEFRFPKPRFLTRGITRRKLKLGAGVRTQLCRPWQGRSLEVSV
jgi:hypothetical protein